MQLCIDRQRTLARTALNLVVHNVAREHLRHEPLRLERVQVPQDPQPIQQPDPHAAQNVRLILNRPDHEQ